MEPVFEMEKHRKNSLCLLISCLFLALILAWGQQACAQGKDYPNKPITFLIPFAVGGMLDAPDRVIGDYLQKELGVPVVLDNRPGAGGVIGTTEAFKAKPDGYTILSASDAVLTLSPHLSPKLAYDPFKDFLPIASFGVVPICFGVNKASSVQNIGDLVKEAKKSPGKLTFALPQLGQLDHLIFEAFKKAAGVDIKTVPYSGTGDAVAALLGKHVDLMGLSYSAFQPYVKSGDVRLVAATPKIPGSPVQNFAEAGYPQADLYRYSSFFVSAKTPKPIYDKLVASFKKVITMPEVVKKLEAMEYVAEYVSPAQLTAHIKKTYDSYSKLTEDMGLKKKK